MLRATKVRIYPTPEQAEYLNAQFGAVRFAYNKVLHIKKHAYQRHGVNLSPRNDLKPLLSVAKKSRRYAWLTEFDSMALQQAVINLDAAFSNFFNPKRKTRFPTFKRKHGKQSSYHCVGVKVLDNAIKIPKLSPIEAHLHRELHGKLKSITITRSATGKYYASILCDDGLEAPVKPTLISTVTGLDTGAEKDQVLKDINLMWDALSNSTLSSNAELRQFAMSISGSVIFGSNGEMRILSSLASDRSLLSAMMSGGSAKVYVCDNQNKCLSPSLNNVTISESKSLIRMVRDTLTSIENKAITDTPLTEREKQFINSTSIPILSWIVDQSSLSVSQSLFAQLTDYIAVDIYLQYLEAVMKVVNGSLATKDYPGANMNELKNGLADARQALNSLRMEVQIKENALISAQQQIRFIRQQVSSKMSDRVLGNYQFSRVN